VASATVAVAVLVIVVAPPTSTIVTTTLNVPSSAYWCPLRTSKPPFGFATIVPVEVELSPHAIVAEKSLSVPKGFASSKWAIKVLPEVGVPSTAERLKAVEERAASATTLLASAVAIEPPTSLTATCML